VEISNSKVGSNMIYDVVIKEGCSKEILFVSLNQLKCLVVSASDLCAKHIAYIHFLHFNMLMFGFLSRIFYYCNFILSNSF
jgi:hypothetical protein